MSEPQNNKDWSVFDESEDLDIPTTPEGTLEGGQAQSAHLRAAEQKLAELETQVAELKDQALRNLAETENVRRRAQREIEDAGKYAVTKFARDLLSVADNLGRALQALPAERDTLDAATQNVIAGIEATERELQAVLERNGIKRIEPMGEPFNPEFHQAVMEVPTAEHPPGTVAMLLAPGYLLKERLLRPAMVGVAKAPG